MSDTITLCTRILLTTQDLHGKKIDHGGSGRVRGTCGSRWKGNMAELLSCSRQSRIDILQSVWKDESKHPWSNDALIKVLKHGLMSWHRRWQTVDPRSRFSTRDCGPIGGTDVIILESNYFYPKIGGHVFTPKFRKKNYRNSKAPKIMSSRNRLHESRYQLIRMQHWNRLSSDSASRWRQKLRSAPGRTCWTL